MAPLHTKLSARLSSHLARLSEVTRTLPVIRRSGAERSSLGHLIFDRGPELVDHVVFVLRRRPGPFPEFAGQADDIEEDQETADQYLALRLHHLALADLCLENHLPVALLLGPARHPLIQNFAPLAPRRLSGK